MREHIIHVTVYPVSQHFPRWKEETERHGSNASVYLFNCYGEEYCLRLTLLERMVHYKQPLPSAIHLFYRSLQLSLSSCGAIGMAVSLCLKRVKVNHVLIGRMLRHLHAQLKPQKKNQARKGYRGKGTGSSRLLQTQNPIHWWTCEISKCCFKSHIHTHTHLFICLPCANKLAFLPNTLFAVAVSTAAVEPASAVAAETALAAAAATLEGYTAAAAKVVLLPLPPTFTLCMSIGGIVDLSGVVNMQSTEEQFAVWTSFSILYSQHFT